MQRYTRREVLEAGLTASAGAVATEKFAALGQAKRGAVDKRAGRSPAAAIMLPRDDDRVLRFAARELERYQNEMHAGQARLEANGAAHRIFIGEARSEAAELSGEVRSLTEDGFVIRTLGPDIAILGKGSRGVLYGCYAFLELQGVRWFAPGRQYEIVPRRRVDWTTRLKVEESPAFPRRLLFYWPNNFTSVVDWIDFCAKARLNRFMFHYTWPARDSYVAQRAELLPELEKRGMEIEAGGIFSRVFCRGRCLRSTRSGFG